MKHPANTTAVLATLMLAACGPDPSEPAANDTAETTLTITADVSATAMATAVVQVTAADIPAPLVFNIPIAGGVASGTVTVPTGSARTFTMQGFDNAGIETHSGSVTTDVVAGANPPITLTLLPLTGDVQVTVTLGTVTISVTPSPNTIAVNGTVQLAAIITDADNNPVSSTPSWATADPGVATVDANGLVTGVAPGTTTVVATFAGVGGAAIVTVTP